MNKLLIIGLLLVSSVTHAEEFCDYIGKFASAVVVKHSNGVSFETMQSSYHSWQIEKTLIGRLSTLRLPREPSEYFLTELSRQFTQECNKYD